MAAKSLIAAKQAIAIGKAVDKIDDDNSDDAGDFSQYTPEQLAEFAIEAKLNASISNPETIIKHLTKMGFVPND